MTDGRPLSREQALDFVDQAIMTLVNLKAVLEGADLSVEPEPVLPEEDPDGPCPDGEGRPHSVLWVSVNPLAGDALEHGVCRACGREFAREASA